LRVSALLTLQQQYPANIREDPIPRFSGAGFHLSLNPQAIAHNALLVAQTFTSLRIETVSPFVLHLFYQSIIIFMRTSVDQDPGAPEKIERIKQGMRHLNTKWRASGKLNSMAKSHYALAIYLLIVIALTFYQGAYLDMLRARESWYD
jgi:hypothetical protein